ncbi:MAG: S9 family peptidase [Anaerolineaceae bacterium]|nr:MAG: S9 family peptidase [Anaerolineaceae bacterium]
MHQPDLSPSATWRKRFAAPHFLTQMAQANPRNGLVISDESGVYQLYAWDVANGERRPITDAAGGVSFGGISPDGAYIYYHQAGADGAGKWVRVPFAGDVNTPRQDITPDLPPYHAFSLSQSMDGALIGFAVASADGFAVYTLQADAIPTAPDLLYRTDATTYGPVLSHDARYAVIGTTEGSADGDFCAMAFDLRDSAAPVRVLRDTEGSLQPLAFAPIAGDGRVLCSTDVSGEERPAIWDLRTNDRTDIPLDDMHGSVTPQAWFADGRRILLCQLHEAVYRLYVYDLDASTLTRLDHAGGTYSNSYITPDGAHIITHWQDATHPTYAVALNPQDGALARVLLGAESAPRGRAWQSVRFTSSGGATVQGWLCTPEGDGRFPLIVHAHGGPTAVMTESYQPDAGAWVDHGFAWLSVNYRGSVTFGRDFEYAIAGMPGHREVDDLAAACRWAVEAGIAHPERVFITGRSYGGYLALQALGKQADLWAGGIAEAAIADWRLMYADMPEALRGYHRSLWGGTPDDQPEIHRNGSPISYVDDVAVPVLVIQGADDERCPPRQMRVYEAAMREAGKAIRVHWFETADQDGAQKVEHMALALRWVADVIAEQTRTGAKHE